MTFEFITSTMNTLGPYEIIDVVCENHFNTIFISLPHTQVVSSSGGSLQHSLSEKVLARIQPKA